MDIAFHIGRVGFVQACATCGRRQYRLDYPVEAYARLQRVRDKAGLPCDRCEAPYTDLRQLESKEIAALARKFPNKKAIYTRKSVGELLRLPDDPSPDPEVD